MHGIVVESFERGRAILASFLNQCVHARRFTGHVLPHMITFAACDVCCRCIAGLDVALVIFDVTLGPSITLAEGLLEVTLPLYASQIGDRCCLKQPIHAPLRVAMIVFKREFGINSSILLKDGDHLLRIEEKESI